MFAMGFVIVVPFGARIWLRVGLVLSEGESSNLFLLYDSMMNSEMVDHVCDFVWRLGVGIDRVKEV